MDIYESPNFIINKMLIKSIGLWPYQNYKSKIFLRTITLTVLSLSVLPQAIQVYFNLGINLDVVILNLSQITYLVAVILKHLTSVQAENKLKAVYEKVAENYSVLKNEKERNILIKYSRNARFLTIAYLVYMFFALIIFLLFPLTPIVLDMINPLDASRPLIFILDGEFFIDKYKHYKQIYFTNCVTCLVLVYSMCAVDTMYMTCLENCVGLFKIIEFTELIETSYSIYFLAIMGLNILMLSLVCILVQIKSAQLMESIRLAFVACGITIHMFCLSLPGQKVFDCSLKLFQATYINEWYEYSGKSKRLLHFMCSRCIKPCQITGAGIYIINLSNFAMIMKTSLSYMTVFSSFR